MSEQQTPRIAILGSPDPEGGETADACMQQIRNGNPLINYEIGLVVTTYLEAGILQRAKQWKKEGDWQGATAITSIASSSQKVSEAIVDLAEEHDIDLLVSLGFRTILGGRLLEEYGYAPEEDASVYEARAINLHPGTVPLTSGTIGKEASEVERGAYQRHQLAISQIVMHAITAEPDDPRAVFDRRYVAMLRRESSDDLHARKRRIEQAAVPYMIDAFLKEQQRYYREES